jgi:hypothetical protein
MSGECQKPTWQFSGNVPVRFNFPQYRFDFEGLNFDCTAPALFLGPDSLQTPSESFGLASHGCSARQFCAHHKRATPRGLQICPTPACGQWPKLVENEAPDAKV